MEQDFIQYGYNDRLPHNEGYPVVNIIKQTPIEFDTTIKQKILNKEQWNTDFYSLRMRWCPFCGAGLMK